MSTSSDFLDFVRHGDWGAAANEVSLGHVSSRLATPDETVFVWLIKINAPPGLILDLLRYSVRNEAIDPNKLNLLEACMDVMPTNSNAFEAFSKLLAFGLSPNVYANGGSTLLQKAIEHNRIDAVAELIRYGVDPYQKSVFGSESTDALEEARNASNAAGRMVLDRFAQT